MSVPLETHLEIWEAAPRRMRTQSRYAALLVSLHGSALNERRDLERLGEARASLVRGYLAREDELRRELLDSLRAERDGVAGTSDAEVARNRRLVWTWDFLSLALCLEWAPTWIGGVPAAGGEEVEISLE